MTSPANPGAGAPAPAVQGCLEACGRCERLLATVLSAQETDPTRVFHAIGPHLRHCIDHFACLLRGLESGVLDYDARDREEHVERDPALALGRLRDIARHIEAIGSERLDETIEVRQGAAPGGRAIGIRSNVQRELVFLSSHTIHHLAIMSLLAQAQGVRVPGELGVAFSTATHLDRALAVESNG